MRADAVNGRRGAIEVCLQINLDVEPIRGTVGFPGESRDAFVGWLGLTVVLDRLKNARALGDRASTTTPQWREHLTRSEAEVVDLVCEGLTNPEIGRRLFVSSRTVQGHLLNVFRKLQVSSRTQLAALVLRADMQERVDAKHADRHASDQETRRMARRAALSDPEPPDQHDLDQAGGSSDA